MPVLDKQSQSLFPSCTRLKTVNTLLSFLLPSYPLRVLGWRRPAPHCLRSFDILTSALLTPAFPASPIPARFRALSAIRALAYPTHWPPQVGLPPFRIPGTPGLLVLHHFSTPTRQAGCGVDPLEQLCSAQLARRWRAQAGWPGSCAPPRGAALRLHGSSGVRSDPGLGAAWPHRPRPPRLQGH